MPAPRRLSLDRWFVEPMKALGVPEIPSGNWHLEVKFDGYRALATIEGGKVELWSRNHRPLGEKFPDLCAALSRLSVKQAVLDGEVVALDSSGRPSFQALQRGLGAGEAPIIVMYFFDLVQLDRRSFMDEPIETRQRTLRRVLARSSKALRISEVFDVPPEKLLAEARRQGWEGIVAKRAGSRYEPGARNGAWLKCKFRPDQEFVIGGFTPPKSSRAGIGALLLGYHKQGRRALAYAGKVGTGFSHAELLSLRAQLDRLRRAQCPFEETPSERGATWVRPTLVCQVSFAEWTHDGRLRQASYLGMRDDKPARAVVREHAAVARKARD